jgi:zinc protease
MKVLTLALPLLLAACSYGQKEPSLPADLPPFGSEKPLEAPNVREERLENGLTVWLVPRGGFPKVSLSFAVMGGTAADPKGRSGLAQLLASTLAEGSKLRTARQIAEQMQAAGGDITSIGFRDTIRVSASILSSNAPKGVQILADLVQNANFPEDEVTLAKRNLTQQLDQDEADPYFLASRSMARVVFGDAPYAFASPTRESIAATTAGELRAEYARRFRPDRAVLVAIGDFQPDEILALLRELFGSWHAPSTPVIPPAPAPVGSPAHAVFVVPRPQSVQTTLLLDSLGPLRSASDYEAAEVANAIYGGAFGSRLTLNIREEKGYAYSPAAFLQIYRSAGVLRTRADVRNEVTGASLNEILYEMNRMATTAPTDAELLQAKRYLLGLASIRLQSQDALAGELADLWSKGLPPLEIGRYGQKIASITPSDVESAGRTYFPASRMSVVAVGEETIIRNSLAPFGLTISLAP